MRSLLRLVVQVEPGEGPKLALSFLHFLFFLTAYLFLKPVRSALLLYHHGSASVPRMYLVTVVALTLVVLAYNHLYTRLERHVLLAGSTGFFILNLLVFYALLRAGWHWTPIAFYVWVACFSVIGANQFWSFCHDIYDTRQAKRLYGFITIGGQLGSSLSGFLSVRLAKTFGTENLILLAAALLAPVAVLILLQHRRELRAEAEGAQEAPVVPADTGTGGFSLIARSRYLQIIGSIVVGVMIVGAFLDYEMNRLVEEEIKTKDAMTSFFGLIYGLNSFIALVIQLLLTSRLLRVLGIGSSLLLLPCLCLPLALVFLAHPVLASIAVLEVTFRGLEYSINHTSREVLYIPLAREVKYKAKAFIDMVGYRLGDSLGALGIMAFAWAAGTGKTAFAVFNLVLMAAYASAVLLMKPQYLASLRQTVRQRLEGLGAWPPARPPEAPSEAPPSEAPPLDEVRRLYSLSLACQAALQSGAGGEEDRSKVRADQERISQGLFRRLKSLADPADVEMARLMLSQPHVADSRLGFEFLDNLFPFPVRRRMLKLLNREYPLASRVRAGLDGAEGSELLSYAEKLGLSESLRRALALD